MFFNPVAKLNFQQQLLQSSEFRVFPSEIILICWFGTHFLLLSVLKTAVLLNIFVETL